MNYPGEWLCKCRHRKDEHSVIKGSADSFVCIVRGEHGQWADHCFNFEPLDNLTYVERLANNV